MHEFSQSKQSKKKKKRKKENLILFIGEKKTKLVSFLINMVIQNMPSLWCIYSEHLRIKSSSSNALYPVLWHGSFDLKPGFSINIQNFTVENCEFYMRINIHHEKKRIKTTNLQLYQKKICLVVVVVVVVYLFKKALYIRF